MNISGPTIEQLEEAPKSLTSAVFAAQTALTLSVSRVGISEVDGTAAAVLTVVRSGDTSMPLQVSLAADGAGLTLPAAVNIAAGSASAQVNVGVINDTLANGNRQRTITANAAAFEPGSTGLQLLDDDVAALMLSTMQAAVSEGVGSVSVVINRNDDDALPLTVTLMANRPDVVQLPTSVSFGVGERSKTVQVQVLNDVLIEPSAAVSIVASAMGMTSGSVAFSVLDDDAPSLALSFDTEVVREGAGTSAITGTVSRADGAAAVTIRLASDATDLTVPATVELAEGQLSASFQIIVNDNDRVDGARNSVLSARVVDPTSGTDVPGSAMSHSVQVLDDDSPLLALSAVQALLTESGANTTTTVTLVRNAGLDQELVVTLLNGDSSELSAPATVTFAAGHSTASFSVSGLADSVVDGTQTVTLSAQAAGYAANVLSLHVSDRTLPDLVVDGIEADTVVSEGATVTVRWTVRNGGNIAAPEGWVQNLVLSADGADASTGLLLGSLPGPALGVGESAQRELRFTAPATLGSYRLQVRLDPAAVVQETDEGNNTKLAAETLRVVPGYTATVQASVSSAVNAQPVVLSGEAIDTTSGVHRSGVIVRLHIANGAYVRTIDAITDAQGRYSSVFTPLAGEGGHYTVFATHPSVTDAPGQAEFNLMALSVGKHDRELVLRQGATLQGDIVLVNVSAETVQGLTAAVDDLPDWLHARIDLPAKVLVGESTTLHYSLTAVGCDEGDVVVSLSVKNALGELVTIPLTLHVMPLAARLETGLDVLKAGMVLGVASQMELVLFNTGSTATGPLHVLLPEVTWMSLASMPDIPSVAAGGSTTVSLRLSPSLDIAAGMYRGAIAVVGPDVSLLQAVEVNAVKEAKGEIAVVATDEFTYYASDRPNLTGAIVSVLDAVSGDLLKSTITDSTGRITLSGLAEGFYTLLVSAEGHVARHMAVQVVAGMTTDVEAFLSTDSISYNFSVVPTEVADRYEVKLESSFVANVPAPVLVVDRPFLAPIVLSDRPTTMSITVRNEGLIQAENVRLTMPSGGDFEVRMLVDAIAVLPAKSEVTIPFQIRVRDYEAMARKYSFAADPVAEAVRVAGLGGADINSSTIGGGH